MELIYVYKVNEFNKVNKFYGLSESKIEQNGLWLKKSIDTLYKRNFHSEAVTAENRAGKAALDKLLTLGNAQTRLALRSLNRNFEQRRRWESSGAVAECFACRRSVRRSRCELCEGG